MCKRYSIRLSKDCEFDLKKFAETQSNFSDSVRYLIEKEISKNGIRNLQEIVPRKRNLSYFNNLKGEKNE